MGVELRAPRAALNQRSICGFRGRAPQRSHTLLGGVGLENCRAPFVKLQGTVPTAPIPAAQSEPRQSNSRFLADTTAALRDRPGESRMFFDNLAFLFSFPLGAGPPFAARAFRKTFAIRARGAVPLVGGNRVSRNGRPGGGARTLWSEMRAADGVCELDFKRRIAGA